MAKMMGKMAERIEEAYDARGCEDRRRESTRCQRAGLPLAARACRESWPEPLHCRAHREDWCYRCSPTHHPPVSGSALCRSRVLSTGGVTMPSTNSHGPKRAILYTRVSTEDQAEEGYSLPEQVRDLTRYAKAQGYAVLGEPIEDDGYSGRTMNRPGLALVRELAEDGAFDVLLVAKWNRLFRRGAYQDLFIAEMKLAGIDVISLDGQKNDTPAGKLFNRMMADFSEYQRDDLVETMQRGKRGRARQGKVVPSRFVPYGFVYDPVAGSYVVNEYRTQIVRSVFRMVGIEGRSLYHVAKVLRGQGAPTPADVLAAQEGKPLPGNP